MVDVNVSPQEIAKAMKLRYVSSDKKGYSRQKKGKGFIYLDTKEEEIKDPEILDHIKGLVIPPAWTDVWISPYPNGHLQATGYDVKEENNIVIILDGPKSEMTINLVAFWNLEKNSLRFVNK